MEKVIIFFGQKTKVACDEKCNKAWGINTRPRIKITDSDEDDWCWFSDNELDNAPENPGTYEGEHAKPIDKSEIPNKWCVRECERCVMSGIGKFNEPLKLKDFSVRIYNI